MSIILRTPEKKIKLYCKGADSIIIPLLKKDCPHLDQTNKYLEMYAKEGLRTLVIAEKDISNDLYEGWSEIYKHA
jgi:phospholipid-transporting ATPase